MGGAISGITDAIGLTKTNEEAPSFSAEDAGFNQEIYDKLGERRDLYQRLVEGDIKDASGRPFGATAYDEKTAVDANGNKAFNTTPEVRDPHTGVITTPETTTPNPDFDSSTATDASGNKLGDKAFDASTATQKGGLRGDVKDALTKYTKGQGELQDQMFGKVNPETGEREGGFLSDYDSATKGVMEKIIGKDGQPGLADQYGTETGAFQDALMGSVNPKTGQREGGIVDEFKQSAGEITKDGGLIDQTKKLGSGLTDKYQGAIDPTTGKREGGFLSDLEGIEKQFTDPDTGFIKGLKDTEDQFTDADTGYIKQLKDSKDKFTDADTGYIKQLEDAQDKFTDKDTGYIKQLEDAQSKFTDKDGYLDKLEGMEGKFTDKGGFLDQLTEREGKYDDKTGFQKRYQDQIDELSGQEGLSGELSGLKSDISGLKDELIGTKGEGGKRAGGVLGEVSQLQQDLQDPSYLMEDQAMLAGLSEQQRAGEARASEESLRRQLAQSGLSPDETSGFLSRFKAMRDPLEESAAGDALKAAQQSQDQRRGMVSDRQNLLSSKEALLQGGLENLNQQQANVLAQAGLIDQTSGLTDRQMGAQDRMDQFLRDRMDTQMDVRNMMGDRMDTEKDVQDMIRGRMDTDMSVQDMIRSRMGSEMDVQGMLRNIMGSERDVRDMKKDRMDSTMDVRNMMRDRMDVDRGLTMDQLGFLDREGQLRKDERDALMDRTGMLKDNTMMGLTGLDKEMGALDMYNRMNQGQIDTRSGALDQGSNFMGNIYQGTLGGIGDMYKYGTFGYQDAKERMNAMEDARLAALGSKMEADMAQYNQPTGTQALVSTGIGVMGAMSPI